MQAGEIGGVVDHERSWHFEAFLLGKSLKEALVQEAAYREPVRQADPVPGAELLAEFGNGGDGQVIRDDEHRALPGPL